MNFENIRKYLQKSNNLVFVTYAMLASFITYASMYAFRKPFTAASFEGYSLWEIDYKIILIISQVIGYMLSKFVGIKIVSSIKNELRIKYILVLIGISWISLFLLGIFPPPYNFIFMFFNGLPLGMIWGLTFSFLEGRKHTELLGAGMSASFIVASGMVKSVGNSLLINFSVNEFWMPFLTGLIFVPFLILGVLMLSLIPEPDEEDIKSRTKRIPMTKNDRKNFFFTFLPGIVFVGIIYVALNTFRDLRDNFAVEIWELLGFGGNSQILFTSELPISILVLIITGLMIFIKSNSKAFYFNLIIIMLGGAILIIFTYLHSIGFISHLLWMIIIGFGMYLSYVSYHTMLFERWIALFKYQSNIGFLMYIVDAFGYLGSVSVLIYKSFYNSKVNWLDFIVKGSYLVGFLTILFSLFAIIYFKIKEKKLKL